MPELAEVEYYRKRWNCGIGQRITAVRIHEGKRIFRGLSTQRLTRSVRGSVLLASEARGKQLMFRFSKEVWLGVHLGMTGKLSAGQEGFKPSKHDHLVLYQKGRALIFSDPRLFGRILFHRGASEPEWWSRLPPSLISPSFEPRHMEAFLFRHARLPIKAALLLQDGFPGIGNWMADEILWRAAIHPRTRNGALRPDQVGALWKAIRFVCRGAMKYVSENFGDPPSGWLFHGRWKAGGECPIHRIQLHRQPIGGRTTIWCSKCQP